MTEAGGYCVSIVYIRESLACDWSLRQAINHHITDPPSRVRVNSKGLGITSIYIHISTRLILPPEPAVAVTVYLIRLLEKLLILFRFFPLVLMKIQLLC